MSSLPQKSEEKKVEYVELVYDLIFAKYRLRDNAVSLMAKCNAGEITKEDCEKQLKAL